MDTVASAPTAEIAPVAPVVARPLKPAARPLTPLLLPGGSARSFSGDLPAASINAGDTGGEMMAPSRSSPFCPPPLYISGGGGEDLEDLLSPSSMLSPNMLEACMASSPSVISMRRLGRDDVRRPSVQEFNKQFKFKVRWVSSHHGYVGLKVRGSQGARGRSHHGGVGLGFRG
jgi:hypothetical protein